MKKEQQEFITEEQDEKLFEIAKENGFLTQWCLDTISPADSLSLTWNVKGKFMTDGVNDVKVELPDRYLTGLELWGFADTLYKELSQIDEFTANHLFIEEFELKEENGNSYFEVFFGS